MSSAVLAPSFSDNCQKLFSLYITPTVEQVRAVAQPHVQSLSDHMETLQDDFRSFQSFCCGVVESVAGKTAAAVSRVALDVFPEILFFITSISGSILAPLSILAGRLVYELSWAAASLFNKEPIIAQKKVAVVAEEMGPRVVQAAVLTNCIAGSAFLVKGVLSGSYTSCVSGALLLASAFAGRNCLVESRESL